MDKEEENQYVSQLSEVFNSCDTTGTGYLDKEELTELCRKLHLEAQLPVLLKTLLGSDHFARVNFEEFKEGFVAVLSRTIDLSISEEESSYLQPVTPEEVKPKFVKGTKRYGRRSRPELQVANAESSKYLQEHQVIGNRKNQLRRSASLESVESLKSDEEAESAKEPQNETFEAQGQMRSWNTEILDSPRRGSSPCSDMTENQVRDIWEELDVGNNGYLNKQELEAVCGSIGLKDLKKEEIEDLFNTLDQDGDGRVSFKEFQLGLFSHGPTSLPISSTPFRQKRKSSLCQAFEENGRTASLMSSCGGLHLFTSIDDGSGFGNMDQIATIWEQEGLGDCKEILKSLDFSLEEPINLADLATALDKEMAATQSRVHQAGLASYRQELQHLRGQMEQVSREKEKVRKDFERAEMRNRQLTSEVDDHHSVMELINQSKISELEQDYKEKLAAMRSELLKESELFMQQADQQRSKLEADLLAMQKEDALMREKLTLCLKENSRLQKEMIEVVEKASESEKLVLKLQKDLDMMLNERFRLMDPQSTEHFDQEERFAEIIREYEIQCRELRDRNDELQLELEKLRSQLNESKQHHLLGRRKDLKQLLRSKINTNLNAENMGKNKLSLKLGRSSSTLGINGVIAKEIDPSPLSIEAEMTKEQLKEHQQQLQDLRIQLDTKVNYYEREIELMKRNFEQERKDTEQAFKIEVSELEEQRSDLEELNSKLEEVIIVLKDQLQKSPQSQEIEKRFEKERAEMEQSYAKEISNLAQSLTREREQMEEDLKGIHQLELQSMRNEAEVEFNQKLSKVESQYAENIKSLWHQHRCEIEDLVQTHEAALERIRAAHAQEKKQWGEKEAKIVMDSRKDRLKYQERMNEEQAKICKTFAIEKEAVETSYKKQINSLLFEVEHLKTCLSEESRESSKNVLSVPEVEPESSPKKQRHSKGSQKSFEELCSLSPRLSHKEHSKDNFLLSSCNGDLPGAKEQKCESDASKLESEFQRKLKEKDSPLQEQATQIDKQSELYVQDLLGINANKETLPENSKKDAPHQIERSITSQVSLAQELQEMEKPLESEESVLNEQLCDQLQAKEVQMQILKMNEGDLIARLEESSKAIIVQESKLQELAKEKEILLQQAHEFQEELKLLRVAKEELLERQSVFEVEQEQRDFIIAQKTELVESVTEANQELARQLSIVEEELSNLRRRGEGALEQLKQKEEEVADCVYQVQADFEVEKNELKDKLLQMEDLVRRLEAETGPRLDDRIEINRLTEDNCVLRNNIERLQQGLDASAAENSRQRKTIEKMENEIVALNSENKAFKDEVSLLSARNLQLSDAISDLCAKAEKSQNTIHLLNQRLAGLADQKEDEAAVARQLQVTVTSLEKQQLQQESAWLRERGQSVQELHKSMETVANLTFQHQLLQQEKEETLKEADESKKQAANLTFQLLQLQQEKKEALQEIDENKKQVANLTLQLQSTHQEKESLLKEAKESNKNLSRMDSLQQEVNVLRLEKRALEDKCQQLTKEAKDCAEQVMQMQKLESELQHVNQESQALRQKEAQLRDQLVESHGKVTQMDKLESELQHVNKECEALRQQEAQLREVLVEAQDKLLETNTRLTLAESQHMREVQHLKEKLYNAVSKEQLDKLQAKLLEANEKNQELQKKLRLQTEQMNKLLALQQEEHEKLLRRMEEKMLEVEMNLKTVRLMLQEKVKQLKEQLEKNAKSDMLLKDLYVENAQLMKALQVTEQRQKSAEKKNFILDEKIAALNKLIRNIAPASLSA
ncbi:ninein-like protein isoform X1 [Pleurodeles waltl]|uniref:ninein-like protein isoform X1 n=1 Tax=Pleurodeles waltl TaxID=8319 RepID=UPI00370952BD